jgi:hypothetical protein
MAKTLKLLTAGLLATVFAIAPVYAQDSGTDDGSSTDTSSGTDTGSSSDTETDDSTTNTDSDADADADNADPNAAADGPDAEVGEADGEPTAQDGLATITTEQETQIREIFVATPPTTTTVDFEVTTGAIVPNTVTLQPLPPTIVEIVPAYEGYQYFALDDGRIVVVEPTTLEVVYILED